MNKVTAVIGILFLFTACFKRPLPPSIGNNISFPGDIVAFNSNTFLLLNTVANGDYADGSIQRYQVDTAGNPALQNVISIPTHGSELAVSSDHRLVALSFDATSSYTQLQFYNFTDPANPALIGNLTLSNFVNAGGKQDIKRLGFFTRNADPNYYMYGTILSYPQDDGSNGSIPPRVFLVKIAHDFSSSQVLFTLSFGFGDANSLAQQSSAWDSRNASAQYTFGFTAPTYDATHDLFIAFPTGTIGGMSYTMNFYPNLPDALTYFSGQASGNVTTCNNATCPIQPDYRAVSLAAVDMQRIVAGDPLNNSVYFVPLGWNQNGILMQLFQTQLILFFQNNGAIPD